MSRLTDKEKDRLLELALQEVEESHYSQRLYFGLNNAEETEFEVLKDKYSRDQWDKFMELNK